MDKARLDRIINTARRHGCTYKLNEPVSRYTTFGTGGKCPIIIEANGVELLSELIPLLKDNGVPYYILGKGSNVIADDHDIDMVIMHIGKDMSGIITDGSRLICQAGTSLSAAAVHARDMGLTGMEFAHGIPGNVGGAVYMNAGAYGGEIKDIIEYAEAISEDGKLIRFEKNELDLSYRHSVFCEKKFVITKVVFSLKKGSIDDITAKMNELASKRKAKQPLEYRSAGSTFKRPEGTFAALLIEECGLKGYSCGNAQVSEKHSGFVINKGNAGFDEIMAVIDHVKKTVYNKTGIMLECEPEIISSR